MIIPSLHPVYRLYIGLGTKLYLLQRLGRGYTEYRFCLFGLHCGGWLQECAWDTNYEQDQAEGLRGSPGVPNGVFLPSDL